MRAYDIVYINKYRMIKLDLREASANSEMCVARSGDEFGWLSLLRQTLVCLPELSRYNHKKRLYIKKSM